MLADPQQIITEPTKVCNSSQSVMDLILVMGRDKISQSGVIGNSMRDHMIT